MAILAPDSVSIFLSVFPRGPIRRPTVSRERPCVSICSWLSCLFERSSEDPTININHVGKSCIDLTNTDVINNEESEKDKQGTRKEECREVERLVSILKLISG